MPRPIFEAPGKVNARRERYRGRLEIGGPPRRGAVRRRMPRQLRGDARVGELPSARLEGGRFINEPRTDTFPARRRAAPRESGEAARPSFSEVNGAHRGYRRPGARLAFFGAGEGGGGLWDRSTVLNLGIARVLECSGVRWQ